MAIALVGLVAIPVAAGFAYLLSGGGGKKKPIEQTPPGASQGAAPAFGSVVIMFECPQCPAGVAYAVDPAKKAAVLSSLAGWYVTAQSVHGDSATYTLAPNAAGIVSGIRDIVDSAMASGASILVDPAVVSPGPGKSASLMALSPMLDPWLITRPDLAMLHGSGPWAAPPGPVSNGAAPAFDPWAGVPTGTKTIANLLIKSGPIRDIRSMADAMEEQGMPAAAAYLRKKADERAATRAAQARAAGGYAYVLRPGELPPFAWTEAYLGAGEGPRRKELYAKNPGITDKGGWNYGRKIKIPEKWPDPEEIDPDTLLGQMGGGQSKPIPQGGGAAPGWSSGPPGTFPWPTGDPNQPVVWIPGGEMPGTAPQPGWASPPGPGYKPVPTGNPANPIAWIPEEVDAASETSYEAAAETLGEWEQWSG